MVVLLLFIVPSGDNFQNALNHANYVTWTEKSYHFFLSPTLFISKDYVSISGVFFMLRYAEQCLAGIEWLR